MTKAEAISKSPNYNHLIGKWIKVNEEQVQIESVGIWSKNGETEWIVVAQYFPKGKELIESINVDEL
jgi:hypothetical protein